MDNLSPVLNNLQAYIRQLDKKVVGLESLISSLKTQGGLPASLPGQYSGKPIPSIEGCEITVAAVTTRVMGNIVFAADGPFMSRAIHFCWRPTAGGQNGMWRPIAHSRDVLATGLDIIDFYWEYSVTGSHRDRQNIPVPSAVLERAEEGSGMYTFHVEDTFAPTSTVSIWIAPTIAPSTAGILWVGFSGIYILE